MIVKKFIVASMLLGLASGAQAGSISDFGNSEKAEAEKATRRTNVSCLLSIHGLTHDGKCTVTRLTSVSDDYTDIQAGARKYRVYRAQRDAEPTSGITTGTFSQIVSTDRYGAE